MRKAAKWLEENIEEFLLVIALAAMTIIMGIQVFSRYVLGMSLSWSEELTRYIFIWAGFLSVSYCTKRCISIKIEQFVAAFPRRGKAMFKLSIIPWNLSCSHICFRMRGYIFTQQ